MKLTGRSLELLMYLSGRPGQESSGHDIGRAVGISSGTLYPLLLKAENAGLLKGRWEEGSPGDLGRPRRRYYKISGDGIQAVDRRMRELELHIGPRGAAEATVVQA